MHVYTVQFIISLDKEGRNVHPTVLLPSMYFTMDYILNTRVLKYTSGSIWSPSVSINMAFCAFLAFLDILVICNVQEV